MSGGVCAALPSVSSTATQTQVQVCCNLRNFSRPLPPPLPLPSTRTSTLTSIQEALVSECAQGQDQVLVRIFLRVCDDVPLVLDRELGCTVFVRDLRGEFAQLALPTAPVATVADARDLFHPGVVLVVTAPEFRTERLLVAANFDNVEPLLLRCDERLRGTVWFEEPCRSAAEWCARGSEQQSGRAAVACFTEALKCDADAVDVLWSRAQAFARLGDWRPALADAERALAVDASHLKSAVLRSQALFALERFDDAGKSWASVATKLAPEGSTERVSARAGLAAALACAKQARGQFDWPRLLAGSIRAADCATFVHRAVELGDTGAHGRGLLCREAIACGTLVLVEAPLNASSQGAIAEVRDELDLAGAFFDLLHRCHGDAVVREKVEQLSRAKVDASDAPFGRRLYGALVTNVWGGALFHWGSFFNHSCMPSCCMSMQAGLMVVQTTRALSAGDELTLPYFELDCEYEDRVARCERRKFVCDCQRCVVDQAGQAGFRKLKAELDAFRSDRTTRFWESARFKQLGARIDADATARRCLDWRELACAAAALHKPPPDADRDTLARFFALLLQLQRAAAESRNISDAIDRCNGIEVARKWILVRTLQQRLRAPPADVAASTAMARQWLCTKLPADLVDAFVNAHF
jgi:tetratricopeptide (TPR) repeat protein